MYRAPFLGYAFAESVGCVLVDGGKTALAEEGLEGFPYPLHPGSGSAAFVFILFHELFDREVTQGPLRKVVDVLPRDLMNAQLPGGATPRLRSPSLLNHNALMQD